MGTSTLMETQLPVFAVISLACVLITDTRSQKSPQKCMHNYNSINVLPLIVTCRQVNGNTISACASRWKNLDSQIHIQTGITLL